MEQYFVDTEWMKTRIRSPNILGYLLRNTTQSTTFVP